MKVPIRNSSLRIAGLYALAASLWIVLSDRILEYLVGDYARIALFQTFKGIFFVVATSVLLFLYSKSQLSKLISLQVRKREEAVEALREKEVLLREVHHRVKNNMQVIVSLIGLKDGDASGFGDVRDKVRSMALVHELLYSSPDLSAVDAVSFAHGLVELIRSSAAGSGTEIYGEADSFSLSASQAIPIGIFLVEACSNAIRHGRTGTDDRAGALRIDLSLRCSEGSIVAEVQDNGHGFGTVGFDAMAKSSSGLPSGGSGAALMDAVASQVGGTVSRGNRGGAFVQLRCPRE